MGNGSTLVEIATNLAAVIDGGMVIDEETGEIMFDADNLEAMQLATAQKFLAVRMYAGDCRAKANNLEELAKHLKESAKFFKRKAERMDDYMLQCAKAAGGEISTDSITVKVRKCPAHVEIINEDEIPGAYMREYVKVEPNKAAIARAFKAGLSVPGCALVQNEKVDVM